MYVGLKQPRGDGERYVTPARAAAKETNPPRGNRGAFAHVVSPGGWALAYPGATPEHLTRVFSKDG